MSELLLEFGIINDRETVILEVIADICHIAMSSVLIMSSFYFILLFILSFHSFSYLGLR